MKNVRDQLRAVLESEGEIRKIVIAYEIKGKKAQAVHNFENTAQALAFAADTLRLSDDEMLAVLRGR